MNSPLGVSRGVHYTTTPTPTGGNTWGNKVDMFFSFPPHVDLHCLSPMSPLPLPFVSPSPAPGGFDGVKIVVLGAIAAIADRVLRIRTVLPGPVEDDTAGVSRTVGLARRGRVPQQHRCSSERQETPCGARGFFRCLVKLDRDHQGSQS